MSSSSCTNCQSTYAVMKQCDPRCETRYCSIECQHKHWPLHKLTCVDQSAKETKETKDDSEECPICIDVIESGSNKTITECGHCFHSACLIKHVLLTNSACPLCRKALADIDDDETASLSEYSTDDDDDDDDDDDEEEEEDAVPQKRTITQIICELKRQGLTERHLVATLLSCVFQDDWVERHIIMTDEDKNREEDVVDVLDNIHSVAVDHRDLRSYLAVVNNEVATTEAGIGPKIVSIL